jgi:hypothetical protein
MHTEILSDKQTELLPFIEPFKRSFYLVGGTAIALQLGHRRSIDFDLFAYAERLNKSQIRKKLLQIPYPQTIIFEDIDQLHFYINDVKVTFFLYPYRIVHPVKFNATITMPTLLSLSAMKAFALGRRAKWKDYVDLYFLLKNFFSIADVAKEANTLFDNHFSEKLFRQQLSYHADIDYTEEVDFMPEYAVDSETIKSFLTKQSMEFPPPPFASSQKKHYL